MDMEYLLAWWEAEFALTVCLSLVREEQMGEGWSDFWTYNDHQKQRILQHNQGIGTYVQFQGTDGPGIRPALFY
jgi:hypothetical protein